MKIKKQTEDSESKTSAPSYLKPEQKATGPFTTLETRRKLWIRDNCYSVPLTNGMIQVFLCDVLQAKADPEGAVIFDGKRYSCDDKVLHRFLTSFVGCGTPKISEPVEKTHNEDGVPYNLL